MFKGISTVVLLVISNAFMTLAWYGHIAFKSKLERFGMLAIVLLSWGIALFEYCFQVPANRIGSAPPSTSSASPSNRTNTSSVSRCRSK